jgi:hypothetical protein
LLLKDAELRKKIGMSALARAKKFDHKHAAEKLERVLKEGKGCSISEYILDILTK